MTTFPVIPGLEGAGVVEALGEGLTAPQPGTRVLAFGVPYSYSEYFLAHHDRVFAIPDNMTMEQAATIGITFMTAWHGLGTQAELQKDESVLIQAVGSGCGVAALQIAKHRGARVIATASTDEKLQKAMALGADDVINYATADFVAEVMRLTASRGVDVIFDGVGGETFQRGIGCLAPDGRMVSYGISSGQSSIQMNLPDLWGRAISLMGVSVATRSREPFFQVLALMQEGKLKPVVDKVFPLFSQASAAHQHLDERKVFGKVALTVA